MAGGGLIASMPKPLVFQLSRRVAVLDASTRFYTGFFARLRTQRDEH